MEDNDDVKVGVTELQEQLGMSEEAGISIEQVAQQARIENGHFLKFFGKEKKRYALLVWPDGTCS